MITAAITLNSLTKFNMDFIKSFSLLLYCVILIICINSPKIDDFCIIVHLHYIIFRSNLSHLST